MSHCLFLDVQTVAQLPLKHHTNDGKGIFVHVYLYFESGLLAVDP